MTQQMRRRYIRDDDRDEDIFRLEMLYALEGKNQGSTRVARDFGVTRNMVQGMRHRTSSFSAQIPCYCEKPENQDGGMPDRWWAED
jgi:hypothetical protein